MKRLLLSALLISVFFAGYSQKRVKLSFTGSPSVNWMVTNNQKAENGKSMLGYDFGLSTDIYFSEDDRYSLLTGIQISNIGGEVSYKNGSAFIEYAGQKLSSSSKIKSRLRYVEIPLSLRMKTNQFNRSRYWCQFGLSGMVNIESKGDSNDGVLRKTNINDEMNLFNLSMVVGIGFDYDLGGNNAITTGLVFQNGLMDVTTDNYFDDKTIINSLKLRIGLLF